LLLLLLCLLLLPGVLLGVSSLHAVDAAHVLQAANANANSYTQSTVVYSADASTNDTTLGILLRLLQQLHLLLLLLQVGLLQLLLLLLLEAAPHSVLCVLYTVCVGRVLRVLGMRVQGLIAHAHGVVHAHEILCTARWLLLLLLLLL